MTRIADVAVLGGGTIGASWAASFLASGLSVRVYDPSPAARAFVLDFIEAAWPDLEALGLAPGADRRCVTFHADPAEAVAGAQFAQESVPERLDVKLELFDRVGPGLAPDAIVASSSSTLTPSSMQARCGFADRLLVAHPFNPPHLIPLVEVCGGRQTAPATIDAAMSFYRSIGKHPIRLKKGIPGHVSNRLQYAIWRKAAYLVEQGVVDVTDVDAAVAQGPGLRWALMGPIMTFHLGGGRSGLRSLLEHIPDRRDRLAPRHTGHVSVVAGIPHRWCGCRGGRAQHGDAGAGTGSEAPRRQDGTAASVNSGSPRRLRTGQPPMMNLGIDCHFARTVDEADALFLAACEAAGVGAARFCHPLRGPAREPLHATVAQLGDAQAPCQLVVVSGTHGIEGYTGAAIQCALLHDRARRVPPPGVAITLVHLINPWGCAWERKETEGNVDLHRNFVYPAPPFAENPLYEEMANFLILKTLDGPLRSEADAKLAAFMAAKGEDQVFATIVKGQHNRPDGIRFNGTEATWSKLVFERIATGWLGQARRFVVLDVHTGWGPSGEGNVMTYAMPGTPEMQRLRSWFGAESVVQLGAGQSRLAVHPRMPYHAVADMVPGSEVEVVALEYGTDGTLGSSIELMREDNFVHLRGDPFSPDGRRVRARTRAHFYWETAPWRQAVLARGLSVFDQALAGLLHWQGEPLPGTTPTQQGMT